MADNIPTPSPLPSPPISPHSLSERINIATRPLHTQLNRLILTRLPLALPPYTNNPSTYVSGLLHIAPIYGTFEGLWATIISSPQLPTTLRSQDACDPEQPLLDSKSIPIIPIIPNTTAAPLVHTPKICTRTQSLLIHLRLPGLLRAGRLRADIRVLTGTADQKIDSQLAAISHSGPLSDFLAHTKISVEANPHVLLAYAWVLYMALFSGGRYLRAALKEAGGQGNTFWDRDSSPVRPYSIDDSTVPPRSTSRQQLHHTQSESNTTPTRSEPNNTLPPRECEPILGLQFFNFVGEQDGEDLKVEFKKRIAEAEILLTEGEKDDIVVEAQHIFAYMLQLVNQLDSVMETKDSDLDKDARGRPLNASRDSVSVAKERIKRNINEREEREEDEKKDVVEVGRRPSHLKVAGGPLAKVIEFRGRIPSLDQIVRRFSRSTPQVSFADGKDADGKSPSEEQLAVREIGVTSTTVPVLVAVLLMVTCYYILFNSLKAGL